ncbi:thioredoxin domain-containing protein [Salinibacterium sp. ZJ77]|uniref:DsbA family protein n=1 Tax=Salinibacterium sp. ZJ77 TaxID=2708337 RepID=UPI0014207587|nr:thioredoxin domain-containing protein [Salinibacterium sp. ZJ77]
MTNGESDRPEAAGNDAREAAKERSRELRDQHRKNERRRRLTLQLGILGGVLVVVGIVAITLLTMNQTSTRGPLNMNTDGIRISENLEAVRTPGLKAGAAPAVAAANPEGVIDIRIYVDYLCQNCGTFDSNNIEQLRRWVDSGAATLEVHPIAILSAKSAGTQYSLRAANAAACVAEFSPDSFLDFHSSLFEDQPQEGTEGLSDEQLIERAEKAGAGNMKKISDCVESKRFSAWVLDATARALNGPLPGADIPAITTVPTVIVDGKQFVYTKDFDPKELALFVTEASGEHNTGTPTPTPTPVP